MTELEQLKADHAAIRAVMDIHRKYGQDTPGQTIDHIEKRIEELEAEQADPWPGLQAFIDHELRQPCPHVAARYVRHVEKHNAKLRLANDLLVDSANQVMREKDDLAKKCSELEAKNAKLQEGVASLKEEGHAWEKVAWKILPGYDSPPRPSHVLRRFEELRDHAIELELRGE